MLGEMQPMASTCVHSCLSDEMDHERSQSGMIGCLRGWKLQGSSAKLMFDVSPGEEMITDTEVGG